jgi:hypothetical protein
VCLTLRRDLEHSAVVAAENLMHRHGANSWALRSFVCTIQGREPGMWRKGASRAADTSWQYHIRGDEVTDGG